MVDEMMVTVESGQIVGGCCDGEDLCRISGTDLTGSEFVFYLPRRHVCHLVRLILRVFEPDDDEIAHEARAVLDLIGRDTKNSDIVNDDTGDTSDDGNQQREGETESD